jgi:hypothetical protein
LVISFDQKEFKGDIYLKSTKGFADHDVIEISLLAFLKACYKSGTQFGTQKGAERAVAAVDAVHAVRVLLSKFSAC